MTDKLNLGSGEFRKEGYLNVDFGSVSNPDLEHDLNSFPYPFDADTFATIEADHLLEHLADPMHVMREIHRIGRDGCKVRIRVPHASRGFTHPQHRRGFDVSFPLYFNPEFQGGYEGVPFQLDRLRFKWFGQPYLKKTVLSGPSYYAGYLLGVLIDIAANLSPFLCSRLWCYWVGGFDEIEYRLRVVKD